MVFLLLLYGHRQSFKCQQQPHRQAERPRCCLQVCTNLGVSWPTFAPTARFQHLQGWPYRPPALLGQLYWTGRENNCSILEASSARTEPCCRQGTSRALRCRALSQRALHTSASAAHQHSTPQTPCSTGQLQSTARPRIPYPSNDVCLPSGTICCSAASPERQKCSIAANSLQQNREGLDCKDSNASSLILFSLWKRADCARTAVSLLHPSAAKGAMDSQSQSKFIKINKQHH